MHTTDNQQELFIVVNEQDEIISHRSRYDCHHDKTLLHRTVGVAVFSSDGKILLQKRSHTKDTDAGKWGMSSAGHVLQGEETMEAAHRELFEELGIDGEIIFVKKFITRDDIETEFATLFTLIHDGPFTPDPIETDGVRFFTRDELQQEYQHNPENFSKGSIVSLQQLGYF